MLLKLGKSYLRGNDKKNELRKYIFNLWAKSRVRLLFVLEIYLQGMSSQLLPTPTRPVNQRDLELFTAMGKYQKITNFVFTKIENNTSNL
jgi:hypothetical protein